tara:strand:- start:114 stop:311 length:198 start_codon:yes stop_codon:yes gene_type:complete
MVNNMNKIEENTDKIDCTNEECENPSEDFDCGSYGAGYCEYCYDSYLHGEWELDYSHPNEGRDDA